MVVVALTVPDFPVMVTVAAPVSAVLPIFRVIVLVDVAGFGLKDAVPTECPVALSTAVADSFTLPVNPFSGVMVMVLVPLLPTAMLRVSGSAERVKAGP